MHTGFLWLIPFFPLVGFLVNGLLSLGSGRGRRGPAVGFVATVACLAPALSFAVAWLCWARLANVIMSVEAPRLVQPLWTWIEGGLLSLGFGLQVDRLTSLMLLFVTGIGTLIHVYSIGYMREDRGFARFMCNLNLFMVSMILLVMGDSLPAAFLGWEGVGLCSYLLIGFWWTDHANNDAARKAFVMNRIGDLGFLLGAFALLIAMNGIAQHATAIAAALPATPENGADANGPLRGVAAALTGHVGLGFDSIATFFQALTGWVRSPSTGKLEYAAAVHDAFAPALQGELGWLTAATLLLFFGCTGKSAQIPLLTWLPDAMAGPTPVSALIHAATMVTAGIYLVARLGDVFVLTPSTMEVILWIGCATALFGAIAGVVQNDIKKVLAYSTVSQLGFMFMAAGVGAFDVALFHVFTHAFFKAALFLGAGSVIHALHHEQDIRKMGGLRKALPWTHGMMLFAFAAIIGVPATSGFFSKDLILDRLFHDHVGSGRVVFFIAVVTAGLTAFYMARMMYLVFWSPTRLSAEAKAKVHEAPFSMTGPVIVLGFGSLVAGVVWAESFFGAPIDVTFFERWLAPVVGAAQAVHGIEIAPPGAPVDLTAPLLATTLGAIGVLLAHVCFRRGPRGVRPGAALPPLRGFAAAWTFGFDRVYHWLVVWPIGKLAWLAYVTDQAVLGGATRRVASGAYSLAVGYTIFQRARLRSSLIISLIGVLAFLDLLEGGLIEHALAYVRGTPH